MLTQPGYFTRLGREGCGAPGSVPGLRSSAAACEIAQVESLGRDASIKC